jgi:hypothetical protein
MARSNGYNECLIDAVDFAFGPAVGSVEVAEHR